MIVDECERFGDWEFDTVTRLRVKDDQALLTLTERKTCYKFIVKINGKVAESVNQALHALKEAAGVHSEWMFKIIIFSDGTEFF